MIQRRLLLAAATLLPAGLLGMRVARAEDPTGFVKTLGNRLVDVVNGPGDTASKQAQMADLVDEGINVDAIGEFCLGRFWRTATPAQQAAYLKLFHKVLLRSVTGHLGEYKGVTFDMTRTQQRADGTYVGTIVNRPGQAPTDVQWVVGPSGKIVDMIVVGTSMRLTQKSDYESYLGSHGGNIDALIAAMQRQVG